MSKNIKRKKVIAKGVPPNDPHRLFQVDMVRPTRRKPGSYRIKVKDKDWGVDLRRRKAILPHPEQTSLDSVYIHELGHAMDSPLRHVSATTGVGTRATYIREHCEEYRINHRVTSRFPYFQHLFIENFQRIPFDKLVPKLLELPKFDPTYQAAWTVCYSFMPQIRNFLLSPESPLTPNIQDVVRRAIHLLEESQSLRTRKARFEEGTEAAALLIEKELGHLDSPPVEHSPAPAPTGVETLIAVEHQEYSDAERMGPKSKKTSRMRTLVPISVTFHEGALPRDTIRGLAVGSKLEDIKARIGELPHKYPVHPTVLVQGDFAPCIFYKIPLTERVKDNQRHKRFFQRRLRRASEGTDLLDPLPLVTGEGHPFARIRHAEAERYNAAILIDTSGSMSMHTARIYELINRLPGCIIAMYSGLSVAGGCTIIARNDRMASREAILAARRQNGGNNLVDGPAFEWLAGIDTSLRIAVHDFCPTVFSTHGESMRDSSEQAIRDFAQRHNIVVVRSLSSALEIVQQRAPRIATRRTIYNA